MALGKIIGELGRDAIAPKPIVKDEPVTPAIEPTAELPTAPMITATQLRHIVPTLSELKATELASLLSEICPTYGINTPLRLSHFIAQCAHESGGFAKMEESLNYSVQGLLNTFGRHRISEAECREYGRTEAHRADQQSIANLVYGGDWGVTNLGNTQPGDGWRWRGAGYIQITGRANFTKYAKHKGVPVTDVAEWIRTSSRWAMDSAAWVFAIEKTLLDEADRDDVLTITKRINGGTHGLDDRKKYLRLAKAVLL